MSNKSQISSEYMMVAGFAALMTIPLLLVYYAYSADTREAIAISQARQIATKIVDVGEQVYYLGKPSQTTLRLNFPEYIEETKLENYEVVIRMRTRKGVTDIVDISNVNISGDISKPPLPLEQGLYTVNITAKDGYVLVTYK